MSISHWTFYINLDNEPEPNMNNPEFEKNISKGPSEGQKTISPLFTKPMFKPTTWNNINKTTKYPPSPSLLAKHTTSKRLLTYRCLIHQEKVNANGISVMASAFVMPKEISPRIT
ncbi:hypothetical protein CEXT_701591 [Caerostris extrusa]|uniref:Uncharacterized protein n=1 Tax=Caerostris extrusa TaxID=172846 RepID=A0AAV4WY53_CAEEX|nr:hypothetical protein CEXT_701591 [Caerostris extrusa]